MAESSMIKEMGEEQPRSAGFVGKMVDPLRDLGRESELHEVRVQAWEYIVEQPESPATSGELPNIPTGLSPLIQKISLKRKHEENYESDEGDRVEQQVKKHKSLGEDGMVGRGRPRGRGRGRGHKESQAGNMVRRKIITVRDKNLTKGSGSCPETATHNQ